MYLPEQNNILSNIDQGLVLEFMTKSGITYDSTSWRAKMQPCIRAIMTLVRALEFIGRFIHQSDIDALQSLDEKWFKNFRTCLSGVSLYGSDFEEMAKSITYNSLSEVQDDFYRLLGISSVFGGTRFWLAVEDRIQGRWAWLNKLRLERHRQAIIKLLP